MLSNNIHYHEVKNGGVIPRFNIQTKLSVVSTAIQIHHGIKEVIPLPIGTVFIIL